MLIPLLSSAGILLLLLFAILLVRTILFSRKSAAVEQEEVQPASDEALKRFSDLIRCRTVSYNDYGKFEMKEFRKFEKVLKKSYPRTHKALECRKVGDLGLFYTWAGSEGHLEPALFLAHYDVVDADKEKWEEGPFSGLVTEKEIWGRGTRDIKIQIAAMFEAAEQLLESGFSPRRTLCFAFGGDEEVMGRQGAGKIASELKKTGMRFCYVMDEGGLIALNSMDSIAKKPLALVGVEEKGLLSLGLSISGRKGHSSAPDTTSAISELSRALAEISSSPFPFRLTPTVKRLFETLAPHARFSKRLIFANLWLFKGVLMATLKKSPVARAMIHTTQAMTIFQSGFQDNVIPDSAEAVINFRILPGETRQSVTGRIEKTTKKYGIKVEDRKALFPSNEPITGSPENPYLAHLDRTLRALMGDAVTLPFLTTASTDSKMYRELTNCILRFTPITADPGQLNLVHGKNERISKKDFSLAIAFYKNWFRKTSAL